MRCSTAAVRSASSTWTLSWRARCTSSSVSMRRSMICRASTIWAVESFGSSRPCARMTLISSSTSLQRITSFPTTATIRSTGTVWGSCARAALEPRRASAARKTNRFMVRGTPSRTLGFPSWLRRRRRGRLLSARGRRRSRLRRTERDLRLRPRCRARRITRGTDPSCALDGALDACVRDLPIVRVAQQLGDFRRHRDELGLVGEESVDVRLDARRGHALALLLRLRAIGELRRCHAELRPCVADHLREGSAKLRELLRVHRDLRAVGRVENELVAYHVLDELAHDRVGGLPDHLLHLLALREDAHPAAELLRREVADLGGGEHGLVLTMPI